MDPLIAAGAAALNGLTGIWGYNRSLFQFDTNLAQGTALQRQWGRNQFIWLYREDIETLVTLTTKKMNLYILFVAIQLSFVATMFCDSSVIFCYDNYHSRELGSIGLIYLFSINIVAVLAFLILSLWFAVHASVISSACAVCLQMQSRMFRDFVTGSEVDIARRHLQDFEESGLSKQLRLPLIQAISNMFSGGVDRMHAAYQRGENIVHAAAYGGEPYQVPYYFQPDKLDNYAVNLNIEELARKKLERQRANARSSVVPYVAGSNVYRTSNPYGSDASTEYDSSPPHARTRSRNNIGMTGSAFGTPGSGNFSDNSQGFLSRGSGVDVSSVPDTLKNEHVLTVEDMLVQERSIPGRNIHLYNNRKVKVEPISKDACAGGIGVTSATGVAGDGGLSGAGGVNSDLRKPLSIRASHFDAYRILQRHWIVYDAYARVCMLLGTVYVINMLAFWSVSQCSKYKYKIYWAPIAMCLILHLTCISIIKLDLSVSRSWHIALETVMLGLGVTLSTLGCYETMNESVLSYEESFFVESVFCAVLLWFQEWWFFVIFLITQPASEAALNSVFHDDDATKSGAKSLETSALLPLRIRSVAFMDVLNWKRLRRIVNHADAQLTERFNTGRNLVEQRSYEFEKISQRLSSQSRRVNWVSQKRSSMLAHELVCANKGMEQDDHGEDVLQAKDIVSSRILSADASRVGQQLKSSPSLVNQGGFAEYGFEDSNLGSEEDHDNDFSANFSLAHHAFSKVVHEMLDSCIGNQADSATENSAQYNRLPTRKPQATSADNKNIGDLDSLRHALVKSHSAGTAPTDFLHQNQLLKSLAGSRQAERTLIRRVARQVQEAPARFKPQSQSRKDPKGDPQETVNPKESSDGKLLNNSSEIPGNQAKASASSVEDEKDVGSPKEIDVNPVHDLVNPNQEDRLMLNRLKVKLNDEADDVFDDVVITSHGGDAVLQIVSLNNDGPHFPEFPEDEFRRFVETQLLGRQFPLMHSPPAEHGKPEIVEENSETDGSTNNLFETPWETPSTDSIRHRLSPLKDHASQLVELAQKFKSLELFTGLIRCNILRKSDELGYWIRLYSTFAPDNLNNLLWKQKLDTIKRSEEFRHINYLDLGALWEYDISEKRYVECGYFDEITGFYYIGYQRSDGEIEYNISPRTFETYAVLEADVIAALKELPLQILDANHQIMILHDYYEELSNELLQLKENQSYAIPMATNPRGFLHQTHGNKSMVPKRHTDGTRPTRRSSIINGKRESQVLHHISGDSRNSSLHQIVNAQVNGRSNLGLANSFAYREQHRLRHRGRALSNEEDHSADDHGNHSHDGGRSHEEINFEDILSEAEDVTKPPDFETAKDAMLLPHRMYNGVSLVLMAIVFFLFLETVIWRISFKRNDWRIISRSRPLHFGAVGVHVMDFISSSSGRISGVVGGYARSSGYSRSCRPGDSCQPSYDGDYNPEPTSSEATKSCVGAHGSCSESCLSDACNCNCHVGGTQRFVTSSCGGCQDGRWTSAAGQSSKSAFASMTGQTNTSHPPLRRESKTLHPIVQRAGDEATVNQSRPAGQTGRPVEAVSSLLQVRDDSTLANLIRDASTLTKRAARRFFKKTRTKAASSFCGKTSKGGEKGSCEENDKPPVESLGPIPAEKPRDFASNEPSEVDFGSGEAGKEAFRLPESRQILILTEDQTKFLREGLDGLSYVGCHRRCKTIAIATQYIVLGTEPIYRETHGKHTYDSKLPTEDQKSPLRSYICESPDEVVGLTLDGDCNIWYVTKTGGVRLCAPDDLTERDTLATEITPTEITANAKDPDATNKTRPEDMILDRLESIPAGDVAQYRDAAQYIHPVGAFSMLTPFTTPVSGLFPHPEYDQDLLLGHSPPSRLKDHEYQALRDQKILTWLHVKPIEKVDLGEKYSSRWPSMNIASERTHMRHVWNGPGVPVWKTEDSEKKFLQEMDKYTAELSKWQKAHNALGREADKLERIVTRLEKKFLKGKIAETKKKATARIAGKSVGTDGKTNPKEDKKSIMDAKIAWANAQKSVIDHQVSKPPPPIEDEDLLNQYVNLIARDEGKEALSRVDSSSIAWSALREVVSQLTLSIKPVTSYLTRQLVFHPTQNPVRSVRYLAHNYPNYVDGETSKNDGPQDSGNHSDKGRADFRAKAVSVTESVRVERKTGGTEILSSEFLSSDNRSSDNLSTKDSGSESYFLIGDSDRSYFYKNGSLFNVRFNNAWSSVCAPNSEELVFIESVAAGQGFLKVTTWKELGFQV